MISVIADRMASISLCRSDVCWNRFKNLWQKIKKNDSNDIINKTYDKDHDNASILHNRLLFRYLKHKFETIIAIHGEITLSIRIIGGNTMKAFVFLINMFLVIILLAIVVKYVIKLE